MLARTLCIAALSGVLSSSAMAGTILEVEGNNTLGTAQNIDTALPVAIITGTAGASYDFYAFSVTSPGYWSFATFSNFSPELYLFDSDGNVLEGSDDAVFTGGSTNYFDAAFGHFFTTPGTYYVGLCVFNCYGVPGGLTGGEFVTSDDLAYDIHVNAVPEPVSLVLTGCGLLGLGLIRKRDKQKA